MRMETPLTRKNGDTDLATGLSDAAVAALRQQHGLNEVREKKPRGIVLLARKFWGLTPWMLEATIVISLLVNKIFDASVIAALLVFNALIGFYNERKAAMTVTALQRRLQVMARVLRNGEWLQLPSRELVPGDVVRVRPGDFLTADLALAEGEIRSDKSALTGETAWVHTLPGGMLYAGSVVREGEGAAHVVATGARTFFGKTTRLVMTASHRMHMEEVVSGVVRLLFFAVISVLAITAIIGLLGGQTLLSMLPLILVLMVTAVPVGLPAMFTISMASGSKELAANGLLVSRLSATEDAATLSTLCIDKTGTITRNEMSLREAIAAGNYTGHDVILYGMMASVKANGDPIDLAFIREAEKKSLAASGFVQLKFTPFSAALKHTEAVVEVNGSKMRIAKGAYTAIRKLCGTDAGAMDETVEAWARKGFKTIAVAAASEHAAGYEMVGIAALYDPPRPDAYAVLAAIRDLGIAVKMLTGDALPIGREIARQAGIGNNIVSVSDVRAQIAAATSAEVIRRHDGFAEVLPEDKFNIVKTLQQEKHVVGMTGDGVNDAPALKQAEVGIAVMNATDVAKQAASIILLREGLQQIPALIRVGRSIHVRIVNYTVNKITKTIQTILFVCVSFILTKQFVIATIDMVLMLFLIDFVVLALAMDKVTWSRKPASWNIQPLIKKGLMMGFLLFAECLAGFFMARSFFNIREPGVLHSLGFACLFFSGILSIPVLRTDRPFYKAPVSKTLLYVLAADLLVAFGLLSAGFSGFTRLPGGATAAVFCFFTIANLVVNDKVKTLINRPRKKKNHNGPSPPPGGS